MSQSQFMTLHEKLELGVKAIELKKQGKLEEAKKIRQQIPMPPYPAKFANRNKSGLNSFEISVMDKTHSDLIFIHSYTQ